MLDLQLRAISTQAALQPTVVPSVENAAANPQKITTWMQVSACLGYRPCLCVCSIHAHTRAHAQTHTHTHSLTPSLTHTHTQQNMADLHRGNPAPKVDYTRAMPDIEQLMQMWSPEMEEVLEQVSVPESVAALLSCVC